MDYQQQLKTRGAYEANAEVIFPPLQQSKDMESGMIMNHRDEIDEHWITSRDTWHWICELSNVHQFRPY